MTRKLFLYAANDHTIGLFI